MDPNTALDEIRDLYEQIIDDRANANDVADDDVDRLVDLIDALDEWITNGGFLPDDWKPRKRTKRARRSR